MELELFIGLNLVSKSSDNGASSDAEGQAGVSHWQNLPQNPLGLNDKYERLSCC